MVLWDPALIVGARGSGRDRGSTDKMHLVGISALGLGDDGSEPGVVHEISGATEAGCKEEVQKKAVVSGCVSGKLQERVVGDMLTSGGPGERWEPRQWR